MELLPVPQTGTIKLKTKFDEKVMPPVFSFPFSFRISYTTGDILRVTWYGPVFTNFSTYGVRRLFCRNSQAQELDIDFASLPKIE